MRNKVLVLVILFHLSCNAMEEQLSSGYLLHGTMINLKRTCISNVICQGSWSNNMVILGENQQRMLRNDDEMYWKVGKSFLFHPRGRIYVRGKSDDSASEDEEYKSLNYYKDRNMGEYTLIRKIPCPILRIAEPLISAEKLQNGSIDFKYATEYTSGKFEVLPICLHAEAALEKASMDLKRCYKRVLQKAWKELDNAEIKDKYIALDALSTQVGFPREEATPVAVKAIVEFLKENPGKYSRIELYVKKRSEFEAYERLLDKYQEEEQKKRDDDRVV